MLEIKGQEKKKRKTNKRLIEKYILAFVAYRISMGVLFWHQGHKKNGYKSIWNPTCHAEIK